MHLENCTVSRKTPGDGKLQISASAFAALTGVGSSLVVRLNSRRAPCLLQTLECTCNKYGESASGTHTHYFMQSELLRELQPESVAQLVLDEGAAELEVNVL